MTFYLPVILSYSQKMSMIITGEVDIFVERWAKIGV